jgi:elongation factor 1-gamma
LIAAQYAGVQVDLSKDFSFGTSNKSANFLAKFPFGKVPVMETASGASLFESNALAYYVAAANKRELVGGSDALQAALVQQFMAVADNEIVRTLSAWLYPLLGYAAFDASAHKKAIIEAHKALAVLDKILLPRTFLVGESVTLADIVMCCSVLPAFKLVLDSTERSKYVNLTRWFTTLITQPEFSAVIGQFEMCTEALIEPKESKQQEQQQQPEQKQQEQEEAPVAVAAPKPKNPLDLLPPTNFNLEDWKRFYSNNETRPTAIDYFWKNFDRQGYSIWWINYRYNDELAKIFMTCNLVTGLFARMDHMRKYTFGSFLIFGEDDKNEISGALVFRGQEIPPEIKAVGDYESYEWTRMNLDDPKEVELFNDYLAWDGDLNGKVVNQGKAFK